VTRQRLAQIVTILILAGVLGAIIAKKNGWTWRNIITFTRPAEQTPEDAVYAMLDAARNGDVKKYLAAYSGPMATALKQTIADSSEAGFQQYLQDTNEALKGVAVMAPEKIGDREVQVRVEYVYQDRNEAQTMNLEKTSTGWKITKVEATQRAKTLIPYGTPVK